MIAENIKTPFKKMKRRVRIGKARRLEDNDMENNAEYNSVFHSVQEFF